MRQSTQPKKDLSIFKNFTISNTGKIKGGADAAEVVIEDVTII